MSTEDLAYHFSSDVATQADASKDVDYNNKSILVKHLAEIDKLIAKHNTFDVIDPANKLTAEQQVGAHKLLVSYLRMFRDDVANKIEELSDGR